MKDKFFCNKGFIFAILSWSIFLIISGCAGSREPLDGVPDPERLAPGLQVLYFDGMFRRVSQVPDGDRALLEKGRPGNPILSVNHQFGQAEVFDSGRSRGVGVQMKGYIHLEKTGLYEFQALSNDGVEISIDGRAILSDPSVHSDRLSDIGSVTVQNPGWHPFMAKYFQRKGTAALKFFWKTPGMEAFEAIPAKAYGHLRDAP